MRFAGCLLLLIALLPGCRYNSRNVDISGVESHIQITRFEKELFTTDPSALEQKIPLWQKEYGTFFSHFCYILRLGSPEDPGFAERLRAFVTDKINYEIFSRTLKVFPDTALIADQLNIAFRHYKYYFPKKTVPAVYTFVSAFNQSAIIDDSLMAIGIDRYLGSNEKLYREAGIYSYITAKMNPARIAPDCMNFWAETEFVFNDSVNNLISQMIYNGRLIYFTKAMLPDLHDSLTVGFTGKQLDYLEKSEKSIWTFLVEHKLLFNTDHFTINKFIQEGPFTADFGRESPSRAAVWTGYRIIESYMKRNPEVTLEQLMQERNYLKMLNQSGYNP
ncbi:MAG TPA: hypothetical protein VK179_01375 [Bacteroidales bacterium]|nr:hypothetical protein [Bacteroidales bacterium]